MLKDWLARRRERTEKAPASVRLGVRGVVFDPAGRVFVVRHSYVSGCYLPGRYVEPGESAMTALARTLEETGDILLSRAPVFHGLFFNERRGEHIACYIVRDFSGNAPLEPDWVTGRAGFFALDGLPAEPSRSTRARLDEVLHGASISSAW